MSDKTLNDLILSAIEGAELEDISEDSTESFEKNAHDVSSVEENEVPAVDGEDIEKIASALEFLGTRGVGTFIKEAAAKSSDVSQSNISQPNPAYSGSYGSSEKKTHHPALASNEAAQNYSAGSARNNMIDPVLKQLLSNADSQSIHANKSEAKNQQSSSDYDTKKKMIKQALAKKLLEAQRGE